MVLFNRIQIAPCWGPPWNIEKRCPPLRLSQQYLTIADFSRIIWMNIINYLKGFQAFKNSYILTTRSGKYIYGASFDSTIEETIAYIRPDFIQSTNQTKDSIHHKLLIKS